MDAALQMFRIGFEDGVAAARVQCGGCGREFYDASDNIWDWDEGELEGLASHPKATACDGAPGYITLEGKTYASDCDCWHGRAHLIMRFLDSHARKVSAYFQERRRDALKAAEAFDAGEATS